MEAIRAHWQTSPPGSPPQSRSGATLGPAAHDPRALASLCEQVSSPSLGAHPSQSSLFDQTVEDTQRLRSLEPRSGTNPSVGEWFLSGQGHDEIVKLSGVESEAGGRGERLLELIRCSTSLATLL